MRGRFFGYGSIVPIIALLAAVGCGGEGCDCIAAIPGGFPAEERTPNAAQLRLTPSGLAVATSDPEALVGALLGDGPLTFEVPPSCDADPQVCCTGGSEVSPCGPI